MAEYTVERKDTKNFHGWIVLVNDGECLEWVAGHFDTLSEAWQFIKEEREEGGYNE